MHLKEKNNMATYKYLDLNGLEYLCAKIKGYVAEYYDGNIQAQVNAKLDEMLEDGTLQTLADTYFDNLDVQEEINNKLDEMVEDGTFEALLGTYLIITGGNAKSLGAKGDGVTDDTEALQDAIDEMSSLGINKLVIPSGEFVVSSKLTLPSNFELVGMKGSVLKYVGLGADTTNPYANLPVIEAEGTLSSPLTNITISGITIDCTGQTYKGGASFDNPASTNGQPCSQGMRGIHLNYVTNSIVENCKIIDLYGDGIRLSHCHSVMIDKNTLNDVGGGNVIEGGVTGWDNFGDGIVAFKSFDIKITNNSVINTRKYLSGDAEGYICGRSGLEFEYGIARENDQCPDYEMFESGDGQGLVMDNNYVYGYTKGIHLESDVDCIVTNNTVIHNNIGLMNTVSGKSVISGNYFNQDDAGQAYQGGYNLYYGGIAVSQYTQSDPTRTNVLINNNIFDGDTTGVHIGRSYVTINNNTFRGQGDTFGAIRNLVENLKGISINGNQFYNCGIHLYHTKSAIVTSNVFQNTTNYCVLAEQCDHTTIATNDFDQRVNFTGNCSNVNISSNNFYAPSTIDASYTAMIRLAQTSYNAIVANNNVNLSDNNTIYFLHTTSIKQFKLLNNNIKIAKARTANVIYIQSSSTDVTIENNTFRDCGYGCTVITTNADINGFVLVNNRLDDPTSILMAQTAGGMIGASKIERNVGNLSLENYTPINSTNRLNNSFLTKGDFITKYAKTDSTIGYYVITGGYYVTDAWTSGTTYAVNKLVSNGGYVYKCLTAGTATVVPTNTTIGQAETGADGVKWLCVSILATLANVTVA